MGGLDVINILDKLDGLLKKISWMDGLDIINILDGLDRCPSDGMNWMLDGLLTTLTGGDMLQAILIIVDRDCYLDRRREVRHHRYNKRTT